METRRNRRKKNENFVPAQHLKLPDLKERLPGFGNLYKMNIIPPYPRPELHVSHLRHDTDRKGVCGIAKDGAFRAPFPHNLVGSEEENLSWWSLAVGPEEISSAEKRLLQTEFPDRTEEQDQRQESFLEKFATSPAFLKSSRFGSYCFTFPVQELLRAYSEQLCDDSDPVLRVFETVLYRQEVMYSVLVHSNANNELFERFPLLTDSPDAICTYRDGCFIWRPEAMCETHSFRLVKKPEQNRFETEELYGRDCQFYVWDNVSVVFHVPQGQMLKFDENRLRECLSLCEGGSPPLAEFQSYQEAEEVVKKLWPDDDPPLKQEKAE